VDLCFSLLSRSGLANKLQLERYATPLSPSNCHDYSAPETPTASARSVRVPDLQAKTLTIRLHPLANQCSDDAVKHLCAEINPKPFFLALIFA
jgi:hypothetical protein